MIYILGGASRSGKTLLARRAVEEKHIPYFPLDALFGGLASGAPEFGVTWNQEFIDRAEKLWPILKPTLGFFVSEERDFLIEGDAILPKQVRELMDEGNEVRSCFLGYAELTREEKFTHIRTHHQDNRDWTKDIVDNELYGYVDEMLEFSKYLKSECATHNIPYFDISKDFELPRAEVFNYLFER
jgi:2-phosphoglycerate kinase